MSETTTGTTITEETVGETSADTSATAETATEPAAIDPSVETNTVDYWKQRSRQNEKTAKERADAIRSAESERDKLRAQLDGKEAEFTAAQERASLEKAALDKANDRILKSEVKAAAKGVLADPQDAYKFLDLDSFEVDDDGNVDESAIAKSLADLVAAKPYLGAQGGRKFQGTADGGARNDATKVTQLSRADLARMSPEQIEEARTTGRLDNVLAGN